MFRDIARLLGNPLRVRILKFFVFQGDDRFTSVRVASTMGGGRRRAEKEMRTLVRLGVLTARRHEKEMTYTLNRAYPMLSILQSFIESATLPSDQELIGAFQGVRGLSLVVAAGILANESRGSVDFLVVTHRPRDPKVVAAVRRAERLTALPLRYAVLTPREYSERLTTRDRLLRDILEFNHRVLLGRR
jgi:hypothetical protein